MGYVRGGGVTVRDLVAELAANRQTRLSAMQSSKGDLRDTSSQWEDKCEE